MSQKPIVHAGHVSVIRDLQTTDARIHCLPGEERSWGCNNNIETSQSHKTRYQVDQSCGCTYLPLDLQIFDSHPRPSTPNDSQRHSKAEQTPRIAAGAPDPTT